MFLFKNFIFVFILVGALTRVAFIFYRKQFKKNESAYLSFISVGIVMLPIAAVATGFDVATTEYLLSLLGWLLIDLLRVEKKRETK